MRRFAQAAKDLQIKKLLENIRMGNPSESIDDPFNNNDILKEDIYEDYEEQIENEYAGKSILGIAEGPSKQLYKCEECEASYNSKTGLNNRTRQQNRTILSDIKKQSTKV